VAGAILGAGAQVYQGSQQKKAADFRAHQLEEDAAAEREASALRAQKIEREGRAQRGRAINDLASANLDVGSLSAVKIDKVIADRVEEDRMQEILYGNRRGAKLEEEVGFTRRAGRNYRTGGYLGAAGSVLSAGATYYGGGWNRPRATLGEY